MPSEGNLMTETEKFLAQKKELNLSKYNAVFITFGLLLVTLSILL